MSKNKYINGRQLCGYLKKIFVESGDLAVNQYIEYIKKESNKKRASLERLAECQEILITCDWWIKNVKPYLKVEDIKKAKFEKENKKEKRILAYLVDQVQSQQLSINDIKSPLYRELVLETVLPF